MPALAECARFFSSTRMKYFLAPISDGPANYAVYEFPASVSEKAAIQLVLPSAVKQSAAFTLCICHRPITRDAPQSPR